MSVASGTMGFMYRPEVRHRALALIDSGHSLRSISLSMGINRSTLREWRDYPEKAQRSRASCPRCADVVALPEPGADYAYLVGLYLGDGCISVAGDRVKGVWKLRIMCAGAWPGLVEECAQAMRAVRPGNKVMMVQRPGCTEVVSCSKHWPCLFPQHGPGKKHLRKIQLAEWQQIIVERYPGKFARGLLHSDGYRGLNRVRHALETGSAGTSTRGICSSTSRRTSSGCAARRWTGWGWSGGSRSRTRSRSRSGTRWRGSISSWGRSTELPYWESSA
jgi:hypothetical protein